jgi:hypothetical protein
MQETPRSPEHRDDVVVAREDPRDRRAHDPGWENRDDHPVGTTSGTGAGATAGAAVGAAVGGPAGAVIGGVIGGVAGGAIGHGIAEKVNPEGDQVDGNVVPDPGTGHRAEGRSDR